MARYRSLAAYAAHLGRVVERMPAAKEKGLTVAATMVAERARDKLGTYQPGWAPLKPETVARKQTGDSPLLETGGMRGTVTERISPVKATISAGGPAIWQELGTSKIPPRPFMGPALRETKVGAAMNSAITQNLRSR
jgi:hypothetical protein